MGSPGGPNAGRRHSKFDRTPKPTCIRCGKPLGATGPICHDCGGTRGRDNRVMAGLYRLFGA